MALPTPASNWTNTAPGPMQLIWVLTGVEVRTAGTGAIKGFGSVQGGILASKFPGVDFSVPQTFYHRAATGSIDGSSCSSAALCIGGGVSMGRVSLSARWLTSAATYSRKFTLNVQDSEPSVTPYKFDQNVTLVMIALGVTII